VSVSFGGVRAVAGADLEIQAGELVGLIGPNVAVKGGGDTSVDEESGHASAGTTGAPS
jgi:ABC-type branched-subunit amino acid transport system ATPase component